MSKARVSFFNSERFLVRVAMWLDEHKELAVNISFPQLEPPGSVHVELPYQRSPATMELTHVASPPVERVFESKNQLVFSVAALTSAANSAQLGRDLGAFFGALLNELCAAVKTDDRALQMLNRQLEKHGLRISRV